MAVEDDENDEQKSTKIKNGAIWSLDVNRNMKGFVSAGADCYAKFWEFDLAEGMYSLGKRSRMYLSLLV